MPKSKFVWYPCRHSRRDGLYWSYRSTQETGTLMHEEGRRSNLVRCCEACGATTKRGRKARKNRKGA